MTETPDNIVATKLRVYGVRTDDDVRSALQALFDVFAAQELGQATFEITEGNVADLWVKHKHHVTPDRVALDAALRGAGDFHLV